MSIYGIRPQHKVLIEDAELTTSTRKLTKEEEEAEKAANLARQKPALATQLSLMVHFKVAKF